MSTSSICRRLGGLGYLFGECISAHRKHLHVPFAHARAYVDRFADTNTSENHKKKANVFFCVLAGMLMDASHVMLENS